MAGKHGTPAERFWRYVSKSTDTDGCWLWTGSRTPPGYGLFRREDSIRCYAHRYAYQLLVGPIADGLAVLHHCDTPPCVRPDHLFLGTQTDNMRDAVSKGRQAHNGRTGRSRLTVGQVREIKEALAVTPRPPHLAAALAERYGVKSRTIRRIDGRILWRYVP